MYNKGSYNVIIEISKIKKLKTKYFNPGKMIYIYIDIHFYI